MSTYRVEFTKEYLFICEATVEAESEDAARELVESSPGEYADGVLDESSLSVVSVTPVVPTVWRWIVTVRAHSVMSLPPDLYDDRLEARRGARRLSEGLSISAGPISGVDDLLMCGDWSVAVIAVEIPVEAAEVWVGLHSGGDGTDGPVVLFSRARAVEWVGRERFDASREEVTEPPPIRSRSWSTAWRARLADSLSVRA